MWWSAALLPFTAVNQEDALLYHSFVVSADGSRIAWGAASAGPDYTGPEVSNIWVASSDVGGTWNAFAGRYDNLYALRLNTDADPVLIFDCADDRIVLCIGDFYEVEGQVANLTYYIILYQSSLQLAVVLHRRWRKIEFSL